MTEQKIKDEIRVEYKQTYPNIIFTLTNTLENMKKTHKQALIEARIDELEKLLFYPENELHGCNYALEEDVITRITQLTKQLNQDKLGEE